MSRRSRPIRRTNTTLKAKGKREECWRLENKQRFKSRTRGWKVILLNNAGPTKCSSGDSANGTHGAKAFFRVLIENEEIAPTKVARSAIAGVDSGTDGTSVKENDAKGNSGVVCVFGCLNIFHLLEVSPFRCFGIFKNKPVLIFLLTHSRKFQISCAKNHVFDIER